MYWEYFNLKSNPFGITPDPRYLFMSTPHASAIEWMRMAIEQHEFGLIVGEVGTGKTVISRFLADSLSEDKYAICWIVNPAMPAPQLLREIYSQLFSQKAPHKKADLVKELQEGLVKLYLENRYPVVIIDEAQTIPGAKLFEELRLLSNYQTDEQNLLSVILLGQPELVRKIKRKVNRAFLQRVRFTMNLGPVASDEMGEYLSHRLSVAGSDGSEIFSAEAVSAIHSITGGYPRPVNHLACFSMMEAMTHERTVVNEEDVRSAAKSIIYLEEFAADQSPSTREYETLQV